MMPVVLLVQELGLIIRILRAASQVNAIAQLTQRCAKVESLFCN